MASCACIIDAVWGLQTPPNLATHWHGISLFTLALSSHLFCYAPATHFKRLKCQDDSQEKTLMGSNEID